VKLSQGKKSIDIEKIDADMHNQQEKLMGQLRAGAYLKQLRTDNDLSLADLGKKLGVSAAYLSNIEQGVKSMSDHFIRQISDYYEIDETCLFELLGRVPLLAREQLDEANSLQDLLVEIKRDKKLTDEKKQKLFDQMYKLYKNFPD
jgi:transcriptional regulator with XRE-family HTH domain